MTGVDEAGARGGRGARPRAVPALVAGVLLAALVAHAAVAAAFTPARLMQMLAGVESVDASFREERHLAALEQPLQLTGILRYRAPDYLKKQTVLPRPEMFEVSGDRLVVESAEGDRRELSLGDYPQLRAFVESLRGTLAGDLRGLRRYYRLTLSGGRDAWRLRLTPDDPAVARYVSTITIAGGGARLASVEIVEAGGDRSLMTVTHAGD